LTAWQHITIPSIFFANLADLFRVFGGLVQSLVKLIIWRPQVIFIKGGFVGLPVGWAARGLRIPIVIHDSDAHPGLTNRLLARQAAYITTGVPLKFYNYPPAKSKYVGIPIASSFRPLALHEKQAVKRDLGFDENRPLLVVTGGGLGAKRLNDAIMANKNIIKRHANVLLVSGVGQYHELRELVQDSPKFILKSFISKDMNKIIGAADVVVARAGATTILELAAVEAPTILVPNVRLTGGHQVKNAQVYQEAGAALVVDEDRFNSKPGELIGAIHDIINQPDLAAKLSKNIAKFARPQAAADVAKVLIGLAKT
jgi:UDP-N-acetylglucosamine--N-acetylmuramyl-(pentapeptide) pyrophosphoryl-undecaprenol N-acetylglucosamine transferase